jgi:hypothetical protein
MTDRSSLPPETTPEWTEQDEPFTELNLQQVICAAKAADTLTWDDDFGKFTAQFERKTAAPVQGVLGKSSERGPLVLDDPRTAPSEGPTPETCWLIERGQPEHHVPTVRWIGGLDWTETASEAARFASRVAAEAEIRARSSYVGDPFGRAAEHVFLADSNAIEMPLSHAVPLPVPAQEAELIKLLERLSLSGTSKNALHADSRPTITSYQRKWLADLAARLRSPSEIPEADTVLLEWLESEHARVDPIARLVVKRSRDSQLKRMGRRQPRRSRDATIARLTGEQHG